MSIIFAIAKRELDNYFHTTVGWLSLLGFVGLSGLTFAWIVSAYGDPMNALSGQAIDINQYLIPDFFGTLAVFLLLLSPALSMRLFSEDFQQNSFELLLSSPITSQQIVLGKFLGALGFVATLLLSTAHCMAILYWLSTPDTVIMLMNYLSTFLMAASFVSLCMLFSAFTRSQLIALALGFTSILALWFLSGIAEMTSGNLKEILSFASVLSHTDNLNKGLFQLKDIVYFISFISFFLFATQQRIEAYRWQ